ncbi:TadE family protein [Brucella intermedia]|uniref:TadE family protein n=1 Tax=Brucella intermedia TaxID=94625 RepID=UPI002E214B40
MGRKRFSFVTDRFRRIPLLLFFNRNKSGTAAVEFAILAPVFLLILMGMIAFGLYLAWRTPCSSLRLMRRGPHWRASIRRSGSRWRPAISGRTRRNIR